MIEEWRDIPRFEGFYQASNLGRIRSLDRLVTFNGTRAERKGVILRPAQRNNYAFVLLSIEGRKKAYSIHRLIVTTFIPNAENYPCVNHIDCDKSNNNLLNLEWCTSKQNSEHAVVNNKYRKGEFAGRAVLNDIIAREIRVKYLSEENITQPRLTRPYPMKRLAKEYGASIQAIAAIVKNKSYVGI